MAVLCVPPPELQICSLSATLGLLSLAGFLIYRCVNEWQIVVAHGHQQKFDGVKMTS